MSQPQQTQSRRGGRRVGGQQRMRKPPGTKLVASSQGTQSVSQIVAVATKTEKDVMSAVKAIENNQKRQVQKVMQNKLTGLKSRYSGYQLGIYHVKSQITKTDRIDGWVNRMMYGVDCMGKVYVTATVTVPISDLKGLEFVATGVELKATDPPEFCNAGQVIAQAVLSARQVNAAEANGMSVGSVATGMSNMTFSAAKGAQIGGNGLYAAVTSVDLRNDTKLSDSAIVSIMSDIKYGGYTALERIRTKPTSGEPYNTYLVVDQQGDSYFYDTNGKRYPAPSSDLYQVLKSM